MKLLSCNGVCDSRIALRFVRTFFSFSPFSSSKWIIIIVLSIDAFIDIHKHVTHKNQNRHYKWIKDVSSYTVNNAKSIKSFNGACFIFSSFQYMKYMAEPNDFPEKIAE